VTKKKKQLFQCVQEMLAAGVIERSVSDYCSPAVLVTKKDGTVRFCTDYRKLNLLTEDEAAPLPKISDALREFGSATVFSAIDIKSGYWQIPMDKASRHLTAFATPDGATYQYRVMPFGLKNAPATFQKLMTRVLEGHLGKFAHVYLGHIVGGNHNRPQPKHLEQIRSAPTPTTRKQLQSSLGLANWVRDYVPRFAELAAPITDLLNKKSRYRWTEEAQQAFEALKEAMSRPLHLHRPDPRKRFFLQTDASGVGIAAVLYQEEEDRRLVISHASAKLNQTQQKYHINKTPNSQEWCAGWKPLLKPDPKNPVTPLSRATMRSGTDISGYGQNHHYSGCHQQHGHGYCMSSTTLQTLAILVAKRQSEPSARSTRGLPSPRTSTNISEPASSAPRPSEAPSRHAHHDEPTFQKDRGRPSPSIIWDPTRGHQLGTGSCSW
jgi:hypothetical protein